MEKVHVLIIKNNLVDKIAVYVYATRELAEAGYERLSYLADEYEITETDLVTE